MNESLIVGWREWVVLPELGIQRIKAKVDTGARTSSLHAFDVRKFEQDGLQMVRFRIHPHQRDNDTELTCIAPASDQRKVTNSGGQSEHRWVISTLLTLGTASWPIEITLTSRDDMRFRMLLGRTTLRDRALVNASASYLVGKKPGKKDRT